MDCLSSAWAKLGVESGGILFSPAIFVKHSEKSRPFSGKLRRHTMCSSIFPILPTLAVHLAVFSANVLLLRLNCSHLALGSNDAHGANASCCNLSYPR